MRENSRQGFPELPLAGHGGNLFAARRAYPQAPEPWLDLSTGINPNAYSFANPPLESFTRLPQPEELCALEAAARAAYHAPACAEVVAAPGTQAIISLMPHLVPARRVGILGFTYCEHARSWEQAGAEVTVAKDLAELERQDVAIIVNPNNPDGRRVPVLDLLALAAALAAHGGLLIADEAFVDFLEPGASAVPDMPARGLAVLRSFGKTYGLPGLRLGFAIASQDLAEKLRAALGPWPVSGAAIAIGSKALMDEAWLAAARTRLVAQASALDKLLTAAGFDLVGGSVLFRLAGHQDAQGWFERLAASGILVRRFEERPEWLRFGIGGTNDDMVRLCKALVIEGNGGRRQ
ncbi:MAG TPA: threonine-phosphate decarboxylase CobD [Methylocella sp.]|nr:threonine-phosphate decarboxylase CobD [Methylocella sp.]